MGPAVAGTMQGGRGAPARLRPLACAKSFLALAIVVSFLMYAVVRGIKLSRTMHWEEVKQWTMDLKPFLTHTSKVPWVWELTSFGYFYKVAQDNKEQVKGWYWAQGLATTAIAAFGGGFLAPLIVCHNPFPFMEESYFWMVIVAWYIVHNAPVLNSLFEVLWNSGPGWCLFAVCFAVFKTDQIVGGIELAENAIRAEELVPHSRYFQTPLAAPFICGFLSGCGGAFLPFQKGLRPIAEGKSWPVRCSFFATVAYLASTRFLGMNKLDMKMYCTIFRMSMSQ